MPQCVYTISVNAKGAKGGGYYGGNGASVTGNVNVTPGQVLQIYVGGTSSCPGTGYNGGGSGASANTSSNAGCGGGGATDLRVSPYGLNNRIIVAAAGGGMGGGDTDAKGGYGGCSSGGSGSSPYGVGGGGGSQSSGGSAGPPWISSGNWGQSGSMGNGGNSGYDPCYNRGPGGGGGGGYYGGGGGGSDCYSSMPLGGGGGGGGSSLTPAGGSCSQNSNSGNGSLTITFSPSAVAGTVSAPNTTICEGQSVNLSVTGSIGSIQWQISTNSGSTWSNISGATGTSLNSGQLFINTCYRVSADCGGTSVYSNTVCITVNPIPIATATPSTQTFCTGNNTSIALASNIGGTTFSWTVSQTATSGATNGNGSSINQTLLTTGTTSGTVTYSITPTAGGCVGSVITVDITVNPNPILTFVATPVTLCYGDSTVLNVSGASSYIWNNGLGTGSTYSVAPLSSTTYTVTGTNSYNCTSTSSVGVTVNPNPIINISPNSPSICEGETISLSANGANTYVWSDNSTSSTINVNPLSTTTYTVTGTNTYSCSATENVVVTVNPIPVLTITPVSPAICIGNTISITASGGVTYLWNDGSATQSINVNPTITTTYSVTIADANSCTASDNVVLTVNNTPPADAGIDKDICEGASVQLNASGGVTYSWSPSNGLSNTSINNPVANPLTTTTYIVTVTDAIGCSGTDDVVVNVLPNPVITILPSTATICLGDSTNITASGATSYLWNPAIGLSDISIASPIANPISSTLYTVTGTNQYACTNSASITITVEPLPTLTITPNFAGICSGQSINLSVHGASTYTWSPSSGLSSASGANITASPTTTTTYTVIGASAGGCTTDTSYIVEVFPSPTANFTANLFEGCEPLTVSFNDLSFDNIVSWQWDFGDIASGSLNTSNAQNPMHTFNSPGTYNVSLNVVNTDGCDNIQTINGMITVYPNPVASFTMIPSIGNMNQPTISFIDQSTNANYWLWNFGESVSGNDNTSVLTSPTHTYLAPGTYTVWLYVESSIGCNDSVSNNITIQESYTFWAPSAFTPNEDGINDYFIPKGTGIDPDNFTMIIYDRWGKEIFYTESFNNAWDGTSNNSDFIAAQGVYSWVVFTKDRTGMDRKYYGKVTLLP